MPADPVQATAPDGVVLRGERVRGATATWLVLLHTPAKTLRQVLRNQWLNLSRNGWRWIPY